MLIEFRWRLHGAAMSVSDRTLDTRFDHLEACSGDTVSSVVDVIPSAPQVMALQPIVSRSHHLTSPQDCQTAFCNTSNLEVAMLHRDLWLMIDWLGLDDDSRKIDRSIGALMCTVYFVTGTGEQQSEDDAWEGVWL